MQYNPLTPPLRYRMYTSLKCLIWGEDLASDPVGVFLSVALKWVSHGSLVLDVKVGAKGERDLPSPYPSRRPSLQHPPLISAAFTPPPPPLSPLQVASQYLTLLFIAAISVMSLRFFLRSLRKVGAWCGERGGRGAEETHPCPDSSGASDSNGESVGGGDGGDHRTAATAHN